MRLTCRNRSAAPRELLVVVPVVTLFFVVVIGE